MKCKNEMLIHAQEAERARIARELHDGLSQHVASMSISLSKLKNKLRDTKSIGMDDICALQQQVLELANEIRTVSHGLHPGLLRRAGLEATIRGECAEFSVRSGIEVELLTTGEIDSVSVEIALCVYRIFQESLRNIQTHANARNVKVYLTRAPKYLELIVEDNGRGFDQKAIQRRGGLGLISMDERVRLVRGHIRIQTQPFNGTNVQLQIPI